VNPGSQPCQAGRCNLVTFSPDNVKHPLWLTIFEGHHRDVLRLFGELADDRDRNLQRKFFTDRH
jgi:hypothetical protein